MQMCIKRGHLVQLKIFFIFSIRVLPIKKLTYHFTFVKKKFQLWLQVIIVDSHKTVLNMFLWKTLIS
jgi:hypothetical protein